MHDLLIQLENIVIETGAWLKNQWSPLVPPTVHLKSMNQLVTEFDIATEKQLISKLQELLPEAGFITEEEQIKSSKNQEFTWVIDPIDGTTNFVHSLPVFCISVALLQHEKPVLGVVYEPLRAELFSASLGHGAKLNGKTITVRGAQNLSETLIATGFPYYDYERAKAYLKALESCMIKTRGVRRMGSAAIDLAYVAAGRFDAFFEYSLSPWDVAAGILLVKEAGGLVSAFDTDKNPLWDQEILASSPGIHREMLDLLKEAGL